MFVLGNLPELLARQWKRTLAWIALTCLAFGPWSQVYQALAPTALQRHIKGLVRSRKIGGPVHSFQGQNFSSMQARLAAFARSPLATALRPNVPVIIELTEFPQKTCGSTSFGTGDATETYSWQLACAYGGPHLVPVMMLLSLNISGNLPTRPRTVDTVTSRISPRQTSAHRVWQSSTRVCGNRSHKVLKNSLHNNVVKKEWTDTSVQRKRALDTDMQSFECQLAFAMCAVRAGKNVRLSTDVVQIDETEQNNASIHVDDDDGRHSWTWRRRPLLSIRYLFSHLFLFYLLPVSFISWKVCFVYQCCFISHLFFPHCFLFFSVINMDPKNKASPVMTQKCHCWFELETEIVTRRFRCPDCVVHRFSIFESSFACSFFSDIWIMFFHVYDCPCPFQFCLYNKTPLTKKLVSSMFHVLFFSRRRPSMF